MGVIGPKCGNMPFDRSERDHFAGDFGETLGPADDFDIAIGVELNDVAGVVPTVYSAP
jgi:hypothetical protein